MNDEDFIPDTRSEEEKHAKVGSSFRRDATGLAQYKKTA